jgi:hypothetical protein
MSARKRRRVKVLLIGEFEVRGCDPFACALAQLDAFREAVQPSAEYGLTLYRATAEDLATLSTALWVLAEPSTWDAEASAATALHCARCQQPTRDIGDCGYCRDCCESRCTHKNCDCFAPDPSA